MDGLSNGILALRRGGRGGKKSAKFKKQAKKRYDDRKANVREQARSNQGSNDNKKKTTTVLSPLEALIANKDELVQQDGGDGVRNQYQVEMNNFKKVWVLMQTWILKKINKLTKNVFLILL